MNPDLQGLKDIHLPSAIKLWPPAPGWWLLLIFLITLLLFVAYRAYQTRNRKKTVRYALAKLKALQESPAEEINIATEISILLRRVALFYFRREDIAGLAGDSWLSFLNRSGNTNQFTEGAGRLLIDAPYRKDNPADVLALITLTQQWLQTIAKSGNKNLSAEKPQHV